MALKRCCINVIKFRYFIYLYVSTVQCSCSNCVFTVLKWLTTNILIRNKTASFLSCAELQLNSQAYYATEIVGHYGAAWRAKYFQKLVLGIKSLRTTGLKEWYKKNFLLFKNFSKPFLLSPCRVIKDPAYYWQIGKELFISYIALSLLVEIH